MKTSSVRNFVGQYDFIDLLIGPRELCKKLLRSEIISAQILSIENVLGKLRSAVAIE